MEEISKESEIPFPTSKLLLDSLKLRFKEEMNKFNELASKMDIDKISLN